MFMEVTKTIEFIWKIIYIDIHFNYSVENYFIYCKRNIISIRFIYYKEHYVLDILYIFNFNASFAFLYFQFSILV